MRLWQTRTAPSRQYLINCRTGPHRGMIEANIFQCMWLHSLRHSWEMRARTQRSQGPRFQQVSHGQEMTREGANVINDSGKPRTLGPNSRDKKREKINWRTLTDTAKQTKSKLSCRMDGRFFGMPVKEYILLCQPETMQPPNTFMMA